MPVTIPVSTVEQLGIVVLVFVFLFAAWREVKAYLIEQNRMWQKYLSDYREDDRQVREQQQATFNARNAGIVEALKALASIIQEHDARTQAAIDEMRVRVGHRATKAKSEEAK
jgi:hypothetical protein